jgi:hypothetical protein
MDNVICAVKNQVNNFKRDLSSFGDAFNFEKTYLGEGIRVDKSVKEYISTNIEVDKTFFGIPYKARKIQNVAVYQTRVIIRTDNTSQEYFFDDECELYNFVAEKIKQREFNEQQKVIKKFCSLK